jgi:hypothetical protein
MTEQLCRTVVGRIGSGVFCGVLGSGGAFFCGYY